MARRLVPVSRSRGQRVFVRDLPRVALETPPLLSPTRNTCLQHNIYNTLITAVTLGYPRSYVCFSSHFLSEIVSRNSLCNVLGFNSLKQILQSPAVQSMHSR